MSIKRFGAGARMSQAVVHNGLVFSAGQVGKGADITAQTKDALANLDNWLAEAGTDKSKILSATIWIANMDDFAGMNAVWDAWVDPQNPPARACTEAKLALPEFLFEVMVTAAV
ncbi:MAG: RidA family protein [Alphaproteobacteria bacterium]|nr:RidA family protein [Alphaproteobacteria bacterium]